MRADLRTKVMHERPPSWDDHNNKRFTARMRQLSVHIATRRFIIFGDDGPTVAEKQLRLASSFAQTAS